MLFNRLIGLIHAMLSESDRASIFSFNALAQHSQTLVHTLCSFSSNMLFLFRHESCSILNLRSFYLSSFAFALTSVFAETVRVGSQLVMPGHDVLRRDSDVSFPLTCFVLILCVKCWLVLS